MNDNSKMSDFLELLEELHDNEKINLKKQSQQLLKGIKKNNRQEIEARIIQMEYDLKSKQMREIEEFEENGGREKYILFFL